MAEERNGLHLVRHVQIEGEATGRLEGGQLQQLPHHHLRNGANQRGGEYK
jgi:hypothetical protein